MWECRKHLCFLEKCEFLYEEFIILTYLSKISYTLSNCVSRHFVYITVLTTWRKLLIEKTRNLLSELYCDWTVHLYKKFRYRPIILEFFLIIPLTVIAILCQVLPHTKKLKRVTLPKSHQLLFIIVYQQFNIIAMFKQILFI